MANITIKNITHLPEGITSVEFETDTGISTRIGMEGHVTNEQEILDHIRADYKITEHQIANECGPTEEYLANKYKYDRAAEYPPITDYLDGIVKGDQEQIQAYIDACNAVKAKYPKGN